MLDAESGSQAKYTLQSTVMYTTTQVLTRVIMIQPKKFLWEAKTAQFSDIVFCV